MNRLVARRLFAQAFGPLPGSTAAALLAPLVFVACQKPAPTSTRYQGVVEYEERTLAFEVPGRIVEQRFDRGAQVDAGARLAALDDRVARGERDIKQAELAAARAELALLRAGSRNEDVRTAAAELESARTDEDIARRGLERDRGLVASGSIGSAQLDAPERQLAQAEAHRRAAEEHARELRAGARVQEVDAAEARVQAAEAALSTDDVRLTRYSLASPLAGRVLDVLHREGEMVGAGAPVVRIADTRHPYVDVFVPQGDLAGIRMGAAARVHVDALPDAVTGKVEDIGREVEFTPHYVFSERERPNLVVRVRIRLDDAAERVHAGVPAFAEVDRGAP